MLIRKFDRALLESEPDNVLFRDLYPWDEIHETPFGASLAVVEPGGQTMVHNHNPAETFIICQGKGTMTCNGEVSSVSAGDVIYLPPESEHNLKNDSNTDSLMFLSVFWDAPEDSEDAEQVADSGQADTAAEAQLQARVFYPSPPTPNGSLHLGHLAGPYLGADVGRRFDRLSGRASESVCVTDDHQSYVQLRADFDESSPGEAAQLHGTSIRAVLAAFDANPDRFVQPSQDPAYVQTVQDNLRKLQDAGHVRSEERPTPFCSSCEKFLFDGHVVGTCPHCAEQCRGFVCESCCLPSDALLEPHCIICDTAASTRPVATIVMPLAPHRQRLAEYHASLGMAPRLRALAARMLADESLSVPVTRPASWGIPAGQPGQVVSPWFEMALAASHITASRPVVHYFGYDNAFLYLIQDPAVSLALNPAAQLPAALMPNEYLFLQDQKMSTSSAHALAAADVLQQVPSDLLRLYLATVRPEEGPATCSLEHLQGFINNQVFVPWQDWLEKLGRALTAEQASKAPQPAGFNREHQEFYGLLNSWLARATRAYESLSPQQAARVLHELMERTAVFASNQDYLAQVPGFEGERATGLALQLAAAKLLAQIARPLTPKFSQLLWKHLGFRTTLEQEGWPAQVEILPPGQRILATAGLVSRRYFPR
jgi:methionyl-tRNA synthetase